MQDQQLTCRDCGQAFTWTAGEQSFYAQKGLSAPTRCKDCRAKKKAGQAQAGGGNFGGERKMHPITCASCGKQSEVPFQPVRDDVLCRDCFVAQRNGAQPAASTDAAVTPDTGDDTAAAA